MEYWQLQIYDDQSSEYIYQSDPRKSCEGLTEDTYKNLNDIGIRIEAYHRNVYESGFLEYWGDVTDEPEKYEHKPGKFFAFTLNMLREAIDRVFKSGEAVKTNTWLRLFADYPNISIVVVRKTLR
jgi:hypothetical protein